MNNNPKDEAGPADHDARFDRLVDGELSVDEYRGLVASLDDEPGGWRRCALAFLESQALAGELVSVRRALDLRDDGAGGFEASARGRDDSSTPPRRSWSFDLRMLLALAASFLIVFALGVVAPRLLPRGPQDASLAGNNTSPSSLALSGSLLQGDDPMAVRDQAFRPVGSVRLVMDDPDGGTSRTGDVPVYEVERDLEQFLSQEPPALPKELVDLLQQRGHAVERHEQYVPFELDDGRQMIVPVERYQITPVSRRSY
jgi:hypothetical protein